VLIQLAEIGREVAVLGSGEQAAARAHDPGAKRGQGTDDDEEAMMGSGRKVIGATKETKACHRSGGSG